MTAGVVEPTRTGVDAGAGRLGGLRRWNAAVAHALSSLFAKSALAWQVFAGTLRPA